MQDPPDEGYESRAPRGFAVRPPVGGASDDGTAVSLRTLRRGRARACRGVSPIPDAQLSGAQVRTTPAGRLRRPPDGGRGVGRRSSPRPLRSTRRANRPLVRAPWATSRASGSTPGAWRGWWWSRGGKNRSRRGMGARRRTEGKFTSKTVGRTSSTCARGGELGGLRVKMRADRSASGAQGGELRSDFARLPRLESSASRVAASEGCRHHQHSAIALFALAHERPAPHY